VNYHVIGVGGVVHTVPYKNNHEDPEALAKAANEQNARLVYLANPDNPMGTRVSASAIQTLIDQLPEQCVLMLDEAYYEFMPEDDVLSINTSANNVIRFRTFSKAYGMAGMRIGYAFGNEALIRGYDKIRNHFGVNKLAQIAAAASLEDTEMLSKIKNAVQAGRERIYAMAVDLDLPYVESFTNFVAVDLGSSDRAFKLLGLLNEHGVFMRKPMQPPQDQYIRVGVGTEAEHAVLQEQLPGLLKKL
jgi:histidinol-phosphate aminotransferase